ncbi:Protein transport protein SEC31 [Zalerion maritima]|uniref:Protein transport protein SEC31 n=1 Tax=Zalerion maritima TaxID=339359 RepID=A0AAD5S656_9PEZI|nr:Protein transport protein SEC31 [Zalerion maritima]
MVRLREIPRTAAFAWSPGASKPLVVTGTSAGAVSDDFSTETKLELWDLDLDNQDIGVELQPITSIDADSRFYDIAWSPPLESHPKGIIAGALENGTITLWDPEKLISNASDAVIASTTKHTSAIKSIQFNPLKPQIFVSAGEKGELFVYDVNDVDNPFRLGSQTARPEDLECVAWNRKVAHILATGSTGGFVHIWDVKNKKSSLSINNRKPVSAIAWDPNNSTKLLTATPDDGEPRIALWNLRNSKEPERILQGHLQGVLSLSWCDHDADLLISSGRDAKTIVWNPQTGEKLGELPEATNWAFLTQFHPHNPNLTATASFDGKITMQTLQNTNPDTSNTAALSTMDDADFFSNVQTQPQAASFSLPKAPKWFERPIGASFGFGGKLIMFKGTPETRKSKIEILPFTIDSEVSTVSQKFEEAMKSGDIKGICDEHRQAAATDEEKADWLVMSTLVAEDQRHQITEYLGFSKKDEGEETEDEAEESIKEKESTTEEPAEDEATKKKRLSNFFADSGDGDDEFPSEFDVDKDAQPGTPFFLLDSDGSPEDQQITKALVLGNFEKATKICLKEKRFSDAFLIANCGTKELVEKVQAAYLAHTEGSPSYLRVLGSVIGKNLKDVVDHGDLSNWKEVMVTICTYATPAEFPDLCEALGDRVSESGSRKDASFCYLVGSKLEKVVSIWIAELGEAEQEGMKEPNEDSTFSVHARTLQRFIEKVTVFRQVTNFEDTEKSQPSDWKLASLYDKYIEYADIVASQGLLSVAQKYLDLLPATYPAAELSRGRVKQATQSSAPKPTGRQTPASRATSRAQPAAYQPSQSSVSGAIASNPYQPAQPQFRTFTPPSVNPYQPPAPAGPYAPSQNYAPPQQFGAGSNLGQGPPPAGPPPMGGPPRNTTPSNLAIKKDPGAWNDVPMVSKPPPVRRATPSMAPITSPFPGQQSLASPPPPGGGPYGSSSTPPPPPPKGPAPPRMTSPPQHMQPPPRPSSAANAYAPPPQAQPPPTGPPTMPRVSSPYNAPPQAAPPTSRYAPAPASQPPPSQPPMGGPPPVARVSPYAPAPAPAAAQGPYNPSHYNPPLSQAQPPLAPPPSKISAPPPTGPPPMGGPPRGGPPRAGGSTATPPPPYSTPTATSKPQGEIPPEAQQMVDSLTREMKRVAGLAPAQFAQVVADTEKRLTILFNHLKNDDLVKSDTIAELTQLAEALEAKDYATASSLQVKIQTTKTTECGNWMVGIKRLVSMSKSTA